MSDQDVKYNYKADHHGIRLSVTIDFIYIKLFIGYRGQLACIRLLDVM